MLINVDDMNEQAVKDLLQRIITKLNDLDCEDYFGTEGWKHYLGFED